jgi:hypothetical protein
VGVHARLGSGLGERRAVPCDAGARVLHLALARGGRAFLRAVRIRAEWLAIGARPRSHGQPLVVVEPSPARTARIAIQDYATPPVTLAADARSPMCSKTPASAARTAWD